MGLYAKTIHGDETCAADRLGAEYHAAGRAAALADRRETGGGAAPGRSGIGVRDSGGRGGVGKRSVNCHEKGGFAPFPFLSKQMTDTEKIDAAEKNLSRLLDWVAKLDAKSSIVLGLNTAMLGVLATISPESSKWTIAMALTTAAALTALGLTFVFVYLAMYPQTKGPTKSLLFFGSIARYSFNEYQKEFRQMSAVDYLNDVLEQTHRNAEIVSSKFRHLKRA